MSETQSPALKNGAVSKLSAVEQAEIVQGMLNEYLEGGNIPDISRRLGFSPSAGYSLLVRHNEQGFKDAQIARALETLETAEADMADTKGDGLKLARAEKRMKAAQWKLERLFSKLYGQNVPAAVGVVVINIGMKLRDTAPGNVIEAS